MITDFVFCTIPLWLRRLGNTAAKSWCFGLLQRIYQFFRRLCYESWIGKTLSRHEQEGHIYKNSLTCRVLDALLRGIVQFVRTIVSLLTFGTYDSVAISLGKRVCAHWTFLDFSFLCGGSIFLMLICPGEYWRNIFGLGISFLLAMALLVITAVKQRETLTVKKLGLPFVIFVFATIVGVGVANDRSEALRVFCFFLTAFLLCIVLIGSLTDEKALKKFLSFIYWAMIVMALMGFYQRIAGVEVSASLTDLTVNAGMPGRVYSSFENPNNYAEAIVLLLPLALAYCTMVEGQNHRIAALLSLLLPVGALLMTYSRSGWVSFALAAVVFVFFYNKRLMPAFLLLALLAIPLLPQTIINRILTIGSTKDSSNTYRLYIWDSALNMIRDYGLRGLGLGPENFRPVYLAYAHKTAVNAMHAHMLYLEIWIEMGLLGIGSYLCYYFCTIRNAIIRIGTSSKTLRITLISAVSSLAGIAFISAAEYIWYYPRVLFCFFILTGVATAAVNISRRGEPT